IVDSLINFASVKYFNNKAHELIKCNKHLKLREKLVIKYISSMELLRIGHHIIIGLGVTLLTYTAGKQVVEGTYNISDFILINGYILQLAVPLGHMGFVSRDIRRGLNEMSGVMDLYKIPTDSKSENNKESLEKINNICFKNVSFRYDSSRLILRNINFFLKEGQTIGIVGETGSGKSTIANLLFNFYNVHSGEILINGKNINQIKSKSLCALLGIVSQDTTLFNTTIYDNILFGNPEASRKEVEKVIKLTHLDSFIKKLPDHYYTLVGERGLKLSGGEKQRIVIARVLLKNPSLYIFDEATSALDLETEKNIMNSIKEITCRTSSIVIAHRLTAVMHANEILVIKNGSVQERGNHQKLIENDGLYASLWRSQSKMHIITDREQ
ncbi:MAG: ATP-binding cassette domain-containing protein, partial [Alphaproteobacteria bacterium]